MAIKDYCTAAEVKAVIPDVALGSTYDTLLGTLATRASRAIDAICKKDPGYFYVDADTVRYFDGSGGRILRVDRLAAAPTKVEVCEDGSTTYVEWASTDYILYPYTAPYWELRIDLVNGSKACWYGFERGVRITGKFGYSIAVPDDIKQAAIIQTMRYFKRGQQSFADVGAIAELGQLSYVRQLDPDIAAILIDGGYVGVTI